MIETLRLQHFRSYKDQTFEFSPETNIIIGPNGSGKTNLLEAVMVLALGGSYRVRDAELIGFDQPWARLDSFLFDNRQRTIKLMAEPALSKSYELDGKVYKRLLMQHTMPITLFEPNHLELLHGTPEVRRVYLDEILEQTSPGYSGFRRNYRRLLSQRNSLLKRPNLPSPQELFPWNLRLSELGAVIARKRVELITFMAELLTGLYQELSRAQTSVTIEYVPKFPIESYETHMLTKLESHAAIDAQRGFTSYGPHREDFIVMFDGRPAVETASRGETRTAVLTLKILEMRRIETARGQKPILLLDDVFSELDIQRRQALTSYLHDHQTFITTTDADIVGKGLNSGIIIPITPTV